MPININDINYPVVPTFPNTNHYLGDPAYVPWEIIRWRRSIQNFMQRFGTPVLVKHRYSDLDVRQGIAQAFKQASQQVTQSPTRDPNYAQDRYASPLSLGTGYVSVELSPDEWIGPTGQIVVSPTSPGATYIQAPMYRGFGPAVETYCLFPDVPRNYFSYDPGGAIMNVEEGQTLMPWYPKVYDGDLIIQIVRDEGYNVTTTYDVYEAKMVNPITMRGRDRRGKPEVPSNPNDVSTTNRFLLQQKFASSLLPQTDIRVTGLQADR